MGEWFGKKKDDPKKLRDETNNFLDNLEKDLKNFEEDGDVTKLKNKIKKSIIDFKLNFDE